jgi:hypothetical protein
MVFGYELEKTYHSYIKSCYLAEAPYVTLAFR